MSSHEEDSSDSDPGDYVRDIGGLTANQARLGEGRIKHSVPMMTFVFKHAIQHHYSSKQPPSEAIFFDLIEKLLVFAPGLRSSSRYVSAVGKWITNNVSATSLPGLLTENLKARIRGKSIYEVSCSVALHQAVCKPEFCYSDLHPASAIANHHALLGQVLVFPPPPIDQPGMKRVVDTTISWLVTTGKVVPSKRHRQQTPGGIPPPYLTGHPASFNSPPSLLSAGSSITNFPSINAYSSVARPLYAADQVRTGQNRECWSLWKTFLKMSADYVACTTPNTTVHPYIQNLLDWNGGGLEYRITNDYVGWLIDCTYANLNQDEVTGSSGEQSNGGE